MKHTLLLLVFCAPGAAQTTPPAAPDQPFTPSTVVATVNGQKITAAEMQAKLRGATANIQQNAAQNPQDFLRQYFMMQRIAGDAEKAGLHERPPYRERLEWARVQILMQAQIDETMNRIRVEPEEQKDAYDQNLESYRTARVKVIYIPYSPTPPPGTPEGRKVLSEEEAMAKAADLVKKIREGADFVKLVKENSEHAESAARDGDFGTIRGSDTIPAEVKKAVFAAKKGEITDPVRLANGFYIFRIEDSGVQSYEQVRDKVYEDLRQAKFRAWFEGLQKS